MTDAARQPFVSQQTPFYFPGYGGRSAKGSSVTISECALISLKDARHQASLGAGSEDTGKTRTVMPFTTALPEAVSSNPAGASTL